MGREISLFSGYDQKENRTTNYCLWVLRETYETSPRLFDRIIQELIGNDDLQVGVKFMQQQRAGESIPDGRIEQMGFTLFLETKNRDWFYWDQIERHLDALLLSPARNKVFIALSNFDSDAPLEEIQARAAAKCGGEIQFVAVSFREFLGALETLREHLTLGPLIQDFEAYLEESGLLSGWDTRLMMVNCGHTICEIEAGAYLCPARGASFTLKRSRWFAPYFARQSRTIHEAQALLDLWPVAESEMTDANRSAIATRSGLWREGVFTYLHWSNTDTPLEVLFDRAIGLAKRFRPDTLDEGVRALLVGPPVPCNIHKDSRGGMFGTKRYFEVPKGTAKEVAKALNNKTWSDLRGES